MIEDYTLQESGKLKGYEYFNETASFPHLFPGPELLMQVTLYGAIFTSIFAEALHRSRPGSIRSP